MDLSEGTVVDRYTVDAQLGAGGMATVYRVRHNRLGTLHAMKVLTMPTHAIRERLMREGRVQGALSHPNIVTVTDVVDVGDVPALVMEYVRGPSLDRLLRSAPPTLEQADALARGILEGVAAAHAHGLVHRDLKPANILIDTSGPAPVPKITDFGLAKILSAEPDPTHGQTRSGVRMGTPPYMAPEQVRDTKRVDARADLFSLGAVLYELVTGERAFDGEDLMEIFIRVCAADYPPPITYAPDLPDRMRAAIAAALVVEVDDRVQTCRELGRIWSGDAAPTGPWDADSLERMDSLGTGPRQPRVEAAVSRRPDTFAMPFTRATPEAAPEPAHFPPQEIDGIAISMISAPQGSFVMGPRRVTLTRSARVATEPVSQALWLAVMNSKPSRVFDAERPVDQVSWHDAVTFCNRVSRATGTEPAYRFGRFEPRKDYTVDDMGRVLYELLPFARVGPVLAHFGTDTLDVLQFEPQRLVEVSGIGARTAASIAAAWDPHRFYRRTLEWLDTDGYRLPTEAEWARACGSVEADGALLEWVWDRDDAPRFAVEPRPLDDRPVTDPTGPEDGPRRLLRRPGDPRRTARDPRSREADAGFRLARSA